MAVRGLKRIKIQKNDCSVEDKGSEIIITFDNPIAIDGEEIKEFRLTKPTLEDIEIATEGADGGGYGAMNNLLSTFLTPKIAPDEFKNVFTIKEHGALVEVLGVFL
jgi:hypothetical protein